MVLILGNENVRYSVGRVSFWHIETDVNRWPMSDHMMKHYIPGAITMCMSHSGILLPGHRDDLKCVIDMCLSLKLWLAMASVEDTFSMDLVALNRILKHSY